MPMHAAITIPFATPLGRVAPGYNVATTGAIRMYPPHAARRLPKAQFHAGLFLLFCLSACLLATGSQSAAAMPPAPPPATAAHPFLQPAQGVYYGRYYYYNGRYYPPYPPACPYRHHFECWNDAQGLRQCGCRPDFGLY